MTNKINPAEAVDIDPDTNMTRLWTVDGDVFAIVSSLKDGITRDKLREWLADWLQAESEEWTSSK